MTALIAEQALTLLVAAGADQAVAIAEEHGHVDLRWANNTLTTNGSTRGRKVTVIAVVGEAFAVRSATNPSDDALVALCGEVVQSARESEPAEDAGDLPEGGVADDWDEGPEIPGQAVLTAFAAQLGDVLADARTKGIRVFGFARHESTTSWLATSAGTRQRHVQPEGCLEWNVKGDGPGQSVWSGQSTRDFTDVDVATTWESLQRRLSWTATQIALPAGRYEVILPPSAVADLLIDAYWSSAGRDADEGRTVWSRAGGGTRVGEHVAPAGFSLRSDPQAEGLQVQGFVEAAGSSSLSSVFDNGLPVSPTSWIDDGVLRHLLRTRSTAARVGADVTPYIDNLIAEQAGATVTLEEMIATTERGLLLTCLWYIRVVDPETMLVTGLTRDGVFLVESGQVVGAVNNFRFNESPIDLLGRVTEVGVTTQTLPREWSDYFTRTSMPAMRIPDFHMSSVSPAS